MAPGAADALAWLRSRMAPAQQPMPQGASPDVSAFAAGAQPPDNPLARLVAGNPVGTQQIGQEARSATPIDPVAFMGAAGVPVMASDMARAHEAIQRGMQIAPTMALGMVGGIGEVPKLPPPGLARTLAQADAEVLSPESTAHNARYTSPEGLAYAADLQKARDLHAAVNWRRPVLDDIAARLGEPGLTDTGLARLQGQYATQKQKLIDAIDAANSAGVDHAGEFPADLRITAPHGMFPGDEKYAHASFAPADYPFSSGDHQYHDPANWLPDPPEIAPATPVIRAFHGSPADFPPTPNNSLGEFDNARIGSGEARRRSVMGTTLPEMRAWRGHTATI
jgi:hypothetical protein